MRYIGRGSHLLLINLLLLGEISDSLVAATWRTHDLNPTQGQICCLLAANVVKRVHRPMSPQQMARQLGMPASRVVTQLQEMAVRKALVQRGQGPSDALGDHRLKFYELTAQGKLCAHALIQDVEKINRILLMAISRKDEAVVNQYAAELRKGLDTDAFVSLDSLKHAFAIKTLAVKRNGTYLQRKP
jgi:DNA-binding MarR family transcriptional regulator